LTGGGSPLSVGIRDVWLVIGGMFKDAEVNNSDGALWALLAVHAFRYINMF
jgi:hypothetical protein